MSCIENQEHIAGLRQFHHLVEFRLPFHQRPTVRMKRELDASLAQGALPDFIERSGIAAAFSSLRFARPSPGRRLRLTFRCSQPKYEI